MSQVALGILDSFKKPTCPYLPKKFSLPLGQPMDTYNLEKCQKTLKKRKIISVPPLLCKHPGKSGCVNVSGMVAMGQPSLIVS